ncbi:MAG: plastocyanin/azurin family copper-binding protein [Acidimicrobiia bacterium]
MLSPLRIERRLASGVLALLLALGPLAVAGAASAAAVGVTIDDALTPKDLAVGVGTTVTWTNGDTERHRMRSRSGPVEFDSGNLDPGDKFQFTFSVEGTYSYLDERDTDNPAYQGSVVVTADAPPGGEEPAPPPGGEPPAPPVGGDVSIFNRSYQPGSLTVGVGATVRWANNDDRVHTVTARNGGFDSGIFDTGGTYSRSFPTAGTFEYFCTVHPDMVASITVVGDSGELPPPPAPTPDPTPTPTPDPTPAPPANADISVFDFGFAPANRTVDVGDTVSWANTGVAPHTVTADDRSFDSGFMFSGDPFSRRFDAPGAFAYFCSIHPEMVGTITVVGEATGAAPPPEQPAAGSTTPAASGATPSGDISIVDNDFKPSAFTVAVGSTVSWANTGAVPHTVTTSGFDSGFIMPGNRFKRTLSAEGSFSYFCTIHPGMAGTVNVVAATAAGTSQPAEAVAVVENSSLGVAEPQGTEELPAELLPASIDIIDLDFDPRLVTVTAGTAITWTNVGELPHTVTGDFGDSGFLEPGGAYSTTFNEEGTFEYLCTIHPTMIGTVVVVGAAADGQPLDAAPGIVAAAPPNAAPLVAVAPARSDSGPPWGPVLLTVLILVAVAASLIGAARPTGDR